MTGAARAARRAASVGRRVAEVVANGVGVALFAALFAVFVVQVAARFGFDRPLPWTDELAVILYIAVVLWGAALLVPWREHVAMDLVYGLAPRPVRRGLAFVAGAALAALAAWALPATWDYVRFMHRERSPVLEWSLMVVYSPVLLLLAAIVGRGAALAWQALRDRLPEDRDDSAPDGRR
jgi:TRAP-type C4-dicarboxylate transport system permease small subunit